MTVVGLGDVAMCRQYGQRCPPAHVGAAAIGMRSIAALAALQLPSHTVRILPDLTRTAELTTYYTHSPCLFLPLPLSLPRSRPQVCSHLQAIGRPCGVRVLSIVGGISDVKQARQLAARPAVIVATPGRLWDLMCRWGACARVYKRVCMCNCACPRGRVQDRACVRAIVCAIVHARELFASDACTCGRTCVAVYGSGPLPIHGRPPPPSPPLPPLQPSCLTCLPSLPTPQASQHGPLRPSGCRAPGGPQPPVLPGAGRGGPLGGAGAVHGGGQGGMGEGGRERREGEEGGREGEREGGRAEEAGYGMGGRGRQGAGSVGVGPVMVRAGGVWRGVVYVGVGVGGSGGPSTIWWMEETGNRGGCMDAWPYTGSNASPPPI